MIIRKHVKSCMLNHKFLYFCFRMVKNQTAQEARHLKKFQGDADK